MLRRNLLHTGGLLLLSVVLLLITGSVFAGDLASFDNPTLTACSLSGLTVSGSLRIGDTVYVEEYVDGALKNTFTGRAGRYSGYASYNSASAYPYEWRTLLSFKDSSGELIEQYAIEGECTDLDTGTAEFKEIELDVFSLS